ncbi:hypothetical protein PDJ90_22940, partial [Bacillus cereus]|nr:hypothetical protein [Bacillus cereus]
LGDFQIVSGSPELLIKKQGTEVSTRPITLRAGSTTISNLMELTYGGTTWGMLKVLKNFF